ncbi:transmembrane protein 141 [Aplysia californica]|uniref:Transmembrane protein 141 n=1 Tax=Aplysia californica TaxID=6500 RepID=A0ABM1AB49_APLCA|nr:transmembrane protein 141 [Aplysia californica]XP_012944332.1 transmembrane protein 141 [Aplysia californica]XP_012944333.1 transmembrane protein 141 [Aplysia californica]XP_035828638.1 transmembrane protein 141 [Aplysia californica]XP_035828639.1 transmembrane protein 141 [Aplysia californica]
MMSSLDPRGDDELSDRYPHYKTYKACQSKAFMTGSVTLFGAAICVYVVMDHWYQKFKPSITRQWLVAGPIMAGAGIAYAVTMNRTWNCQNMWMAMEERHSALTPAKERLAMRIAEDEED